MNITWLDINASYSHSSLALPALESQLETEVRKRCTINVVCGTIKSPIEDIIDQTIKSAPQYILATGWLFNIGYLLSVLSRINAIDNKIKIVLGGPEFLGNNEEFLKMNKFITALFKGDGEEHFNEFIDIISKEPTSLEWLELPGFEYLNNDRFVAKESVVTEEFETLTPPEESEYFRWDKAFIQIETSRGCFNSCRFCVSGINKSKVMDIPIESIRKRVDTICQKGIREIRVLDRTFNANASRAVALLSLFKEFAGKLKFHLEVHPALLAPSVKEALRDIPADLLHIEAGIQSLDENVLLECARKGTAEQAMKGLDFLIGLGKFEVHTDFIAGLPGYSFEMLMCDIQRMISTGPGEIQLELLKLLPGTIFREKSEEYGIKYSPYPPYEVLQTDSITFNQLKRVKVLSKILEYWYNDKRWMNCFRKAVSADENFLSLLLEELEKSPFYETLHSFESKSTILYDFCCSHYPQLCDEISLNWIRCGLSLKKEPANKLRMWHFNDKQTINPIFDSNERLNIYYYFDYEDLRYWFAFNRSKERNMPTKEYTEKRN